jgi:hypothetical protein
MKSMTKESISEVQKNVHQWMTIIGFPILIILVGDMYIDFKNVRNNDIRQDERISNLKAEVIDVKQSIQTMGNYVYRGVK